MPTIVTTVSEAVVTDIVVEPYLHLVCQQDCLRYFSHGFAIVHTCLLYLAESLLLSETLFFHQHTLGTLNYLACLQLFGQVASLFFNGAKLIVAIKGKFNCRRHLAFA